VGTQSDSHTASVFWSTISYYAFGQYSRTKFSIMHNGILPWSFGSMKWIPKRRSRNLAESSHSHGTCDVVSAWVLSHAPVAVRPRYRLVSPRFLCLFLVLLDNLIFPSEACLPCRLLVSSPLRRFARIDSFLWRYARTSGSLGGDLDG
jgi:hypothetical protein